MAGAERFKTTQIPRSPRELSRLKVIQGPDNGAVYVVSSSRVTIGRGEENDILIADLKSSRVHAEIQFIRDKQAWKVKDLGSANGILVNGKLVIESNLKSGDILGVGETLFEFQYSAIESTQMLQASPKSALSVLQEHRARENQEARVASIRGAKQGSLADVARLVTAPVGGAHAAQNKSLLKNPLVVLLLVGLGAAALLMDENPEAVKGIKRRLKGDLPILANSRDLASYLPPDEDPALKQNEKVLAASVTGLMSSNRTISMFMKAGFREYSQGNFLRAKVQFENVLQISPSNPVAKIYYEKSTKKIETDVKKYMDLARKDFEAGKIRNAKGQFEAVLRLLFRDQSNPNFVEAKEQIERIVQALNDGDNTKLREPLKKAKKPGGESDDDSSDSSGDSSKDAPKGTPSNAEGRSG